MHFTEIDKINGTITWDGELPQVKFARHSSVSAVFSNLSGAIKITTPKEPLEKVILASWRSRIACFPFLVLHNP